MNEDYKILTEGGTAETELKKSRFIANVAPAASKEEAEAFIDKIKKKYFDARHNCYAYVIGKDGDVAKFSDDGEPGQTAGLPMYSVIKESGIRNVVVVVTRYFGGTLLGAGPLSGMYREATALGLSASQTAWMRFGTEVKVGTDYADGDKTKRYFERENIEVVDITYSERVVCTIRTSSDNYENMVRDVTSITASRAEFFDKKEAYFIDRNS